MTAEPSSRVGLEKVGRCLAAIALVALAAACSSGQATVNPAGPTAWTSADATFATPPATIRTRTQGTVVSRSVTGTLNGRFAFIPTGDEWWEFYSESNSTGTLTHLGLSRMYTRHTPDLSGTLNEGTFQIVAANGDELTGTYEGSATADPERADVYHGVATFVITAGTGRFAEATGFFNARLVETLDDPTWASAKVVWTLVGTVNY